MAAIAIIGLAGRFPGSPDVDAFWDGILEDRCAIAPMPRARFDPRYFDPEPGAYAKSYSRIGGMVEAPPFDPRPYKIPPRTASETDIAHLWALDVARATLEDAGWDPFGPSRNVGVLIGHARGSMRTADLAFATGIEGLLAALDAPLEGALSGLDELKTARDVVIHRVRERYGHRTEDGSVGAMTSGLAGLIANAFGFTGRHAVVDAACASTLAAVQMGVNALRTGHLDAALVGGASYSQEISVVMFAQSRALSGEGSYPFDARASGFVSSDGVGLFLLKRLDDALRDGDPVRAVIRGVGAACDGKGRALWSPQQGGQILAMSRALADGEVDPASVGVVEAHATSTRLGDRVEVDAMHEVFGARPRPLPIGSVKGNIGHAREAAGAAGLAKMIRALETATLPPTGGFRQPSPDIAWDERNVEVLTSGRPWSATGPRRAGVNAFGIGGLDHHVVLEEAPAGKVWAQPSAPEAEPISVALVGMGVRLPGASDVEQLWQNLRAGVDVSRPVPPERWDSDLYHQAGSPAPHRSYVNRGYFVEGFEPDWRRYKLPPKLIERNDPLQFMVLESALDALAMAGLEPSALPKSRTATVVGTVFGSDFALELSESVRAREAADDLVDVLGDSSLHAALLEQLRSRKPSINEDSSGSFSSSTLASRVAKTLDLNGFTSTLDAACASSLAAIEAAYELLATRQADVVLAGGGDRAMRVQRFEAYCGIGALSPRGRGVPYDQAADGFVCGEGAAMLVLMRLDEARARELPVKAILRGVGSSSEGQRAGMFRPSVEGLSRAMTRALEAARLPPEAVGYIEGHGGGTSAGDTTELEALSVVYAPRLERGPLHLGSIKSQLGHLQGAAGVAGVIQATLVLQHGEVPPIPGFERLRGSEGLTVSARAEPFPAGASAAAVSAMGLGGIDYHLLLSRPEEDCSPDALPLSVLRGHDLDAALRQQPLWGETTGQGDASIVFSAEDAPSLERQAALVRKVGFSPTTQTVLEKQGVFANAQRPARKLAFAFSGQGSQYDGMWLEALAGCPAAEARFEELDAALRRVVGAAAQADLYTDWRRGRALPTTDVFAVQALVLAADLVAATWLDELGIDADVVTGHSYGDYAALVYAGAWSAETALAATWARAQAVNVAQVRGGMLAFEGSRASAETLVRGVEGLFVANINASDQIVLAGTQAALTAALERHPAARRLGVPAPFHSPLMAPAAERFRAYLRSVELKSPERPYLSSVTGSLESEPQTILRQLGDQMTEPVHFPNQLARLVEMGVGAVIETGPREVLTGLIRRDRPLRAVATDHPKRSPLASATQLRAALWAAQTPDRVAMDQVEPDTPDPSQATGPSLAGLEHLERQPGFEAFFERIQPSLTTLVESLWAAEKPTAELDAASATMTPEPLDEAGPAVDPAEVQAFLMDAICEASGYPPDIVELDADLEADLGIDTVKQAQVLGRLRDEYRLRTESQLSLRDFPTLRHMLDYAQRQLEDRSVAAPRPSRVPVVDLTSRRSQRSARAPRKSTPPAVAESNADDGVPQQPARSRPVLAAETEIFPLDVPASAPPSLELPVIPAPIDPVDLDEPWAVPVLDLEGTPRACGQAHGERLRDPIREVMGRYLDFVGNHGLNQLDVPAQVERARTELPPNVLEELAGVAEAVGVPETWLIAYNLDAALFPAHGGCTQGLRPAGSNGGEAIHFVNEDSPLMLHLGVKALPRIVQRRRQQGRAWLTFSLAGQVAGINGVRSDGWSLTSTTLLDGHPTADIGLPHPFLVRQLLETAESAEHAIEQAREARRMGRWSMLVHDTRTDRARYLEYDGARILSDHPVEGGWVSTNHALAPSSAVAPEHSRHRLDRARDLLAARSKMDRTAALALLRDEFDPARGRKVSFATMNTVRRVDNVMSLVLDARQGAAHVTATVGTPTPEVQSIPVEARAATKTMQRHVGRIVTSDALPRTKRADVGTLAIVGSGRMDAARHFATMVGASRVDTTEEAETLLLCPGREASALDEAFDAVRGWARRGRRLLALTELGGRFGEASGPVPAPWHGGVVGLVKAARRELGVQACALDLSTAESDEAAASALAAEVAAGCPRVEVGLLRGRRQLWTWPARDVPAPGPRRHPWPARWLVTGGGRGISFRIARTLALRTGAELILVGRRPAPPLARAAWGPAEIEAQEATLLNELRAEPGFTPRAFQQAKEALAAELELARNLTSLATAGLAARYVAVDVSDAGALAEKWAEIVNSGPIQGVIHGAGWERARRLEAKTKEDFDRTVGPKVAGLEALLSHLDLSSLTDFIGFGSVSGRFGGHGQADYSLANDALASRLRALSEEHPHLGVTCFAWAAFGEVGLAARGSAKAFLEQTGQAFMTPEEGAEHVYDELAAGLPETEIVVCGPLPELDLDQTLVSAGSAITLAGCRVEARGTTNGWREAELRLDPSRPVLDEHRIGPQPTLPAAAMSLLLGGWSETQHLREVRIHAPLKVPTPREAELRARGQQVELRATARRPDGVVLEPSRLYAMAQIGALSPAPAFEMAPMLGADRPPYADRWSEVRHVPWHGPSYQVLRGHVFDPSTKVGWARLVAPDTQDSSLVHVCLLDGALQAAGLFARLDGRGLALPAGFDTLSWWTIPSPAEPVMVRITLVGPGLTDIDAWTENRQAYLRAQGYRSTEVPA